MTAVTTSVVDARGLLTEWDDLATRTDASPFLRPGWLLAWHDAFGRFPLHAVAARRGDRLCALVPLQGRGGALSSPTNWHSPDFDIIAEDAPARAAVLQAALAAAPWRLALSFVDGSTTADVITSAQQHGRGSASTVIERSPFIAAAGTFEDYRATLPPKALKEIVRRRRRLEEHGDLVLSVHRTADPTLLERFMSVEGSGWKSDGGTALAQEPATRAFYEAVAAWSAREGLLRLTLLTLNGRVLAGDFALYVGRTHYLLKTGYDPDYRTFGPGKLLRLLALEAAFEEGLDTYEFLGDATPWKSEWTQTTRDRHRVWAFGRGPRAVTRLELPLRRVAKSGLQKVQQWRAR